MPVRWNPFTNDFDITGTPAGGNPVIALDGDTGQAIPDASNVIKIAGGVDINVVAAGSTVTVSSTATGGITWVEETTTSRALAVDEGVIGNNAATITMTLPTTAALGDVIRIAGKGAGLVKIAQNASEIIHFGTATTTTGPGGYLESTQTNDAVEILCIVADTEWQVLSSQGNWTIV